MSRALLSILCAAASLSLISHAGVLARAPPMRTLLPEVPIVHESLPDTGEATYRIRAPLEKDSHYEVLVSHSASEGAAFRVEWAGKRQRNPGSRALLNTEKLSFATGPDGLPIAEAVNGEDGPELSEVGKQALLILN